MYLPFIGQLQSDPLSIDITELWAVVSLARLKGFTVTIENENHYDSMTYYYKEEI